MVFGRVLTQPIGGGVVVGCGGCDEEEEGTVIVRSMLSRLEPVSHARRYCFLLFGVLVILALYQYLFFSLSYSLYAWQLYRIGASRYTVMVESGNHTVAAAASVTSLILHQTYRTRDSVPSMWHNTSESCRQKHAHWTHQYFWTDETGRDFIKQHFSADALANYDSYMFPIQRADALRYYVLYHYGGVYLDLDIGCLYALDHRGVTRYPFALASTVPIGFSNDFIMAQRGHPFLLHLIERLPRYNQWYINYYLTVMYSTGPMFLTINYIEYMHTMMPLSPDYAIYVLNETLYGATNHTESLFYHVEGSSWHNYKIPVAAAASS